MAFLNNISFNPNSIRDLRELISTSVWTDEDFRKYVNLKAAMNGEGIGLIGDLEDIGKSGSGCSPTYETPSMANSQKVWALGDWQIPLELCYTDIEGTIAEYSMKTGTDVADLTDTDFMNIVLQPALEKAVRRMFMRFAWFGDTAADTIANGGNLTNGTDKKLFNVCDGLFKRLFAIGTNDSNRVETIAANSQNTYAAQKSAILTQGVATTLFDNIIYNAPASVKSNPNAVIMCTRGLADALARDVKAVYKINMKWETIFTGFDIAEYDGVKVGRIALWDEIIAAYEDTGAAYYRPYRAVFADPENLLVGIRTYRRNIATPDGQQSVPDLFEGFDIWFEKKDRTTNIFAQGKIGTLIAEDDKVQLAY